MKEILKVLMISLVASLAISSCDKKPVAVPRPEAWPRPVSDTAVTITDSIATADGTRFVTFSYPRWEIDVYVTVTPIQKNNFVKTINNRLQRIRLNAGSLPISVEEQGRLTTFRTRASLPTPLQFIETDTATRIVSGAVYLKNPIAPSNPDSVEAVVDSVATHLPDLINAL